MFCWFLWVEAQTLAVPIADTLYSSVPFTTFKYISARKSNRFKWDFDGGGDRIWPKSCRGAMTPDLLIGESNANKNMVHC